MWFKMDEYCQSVFLLNMAQWLKMANKCIKWFEFYQNWLKLERNKFKIGKNCDSWWLFVGYSLKQLVCRLLYKTAYL